MSGEGWSWKPNTEGINDNISLPHQRGFDIGHIVLQTVTKMLRVVAEVRWVSTRGALRRASSLGGCGTPALMQGQPGYSEVT